MSALRASRDEQDVTNRQREQQQQEKLQGLRAELDALTAEADDAQRRLDGWTQLRNNVLRGIDALFHLVKCDNSPLLELLGTRRSRHLKKGAALSKCAGNQMYSTNLYFFSGNS